MINLRDEFLKGYLEGDTGDEIVRFEDVSRSVGFMTLSCVQTEATKKDSAVFKTQT